MSHVPSSPVPTTQRPVRVRIAPSPTGDPHVGTAYVALFNHVFAKKQGGKFILRIEDTDRTRARADSEGLIMECLRWAGLTWDEGPDVGGPHAPYRQSERTEIYQKHAHELVEKGHAYHCFCTPQRLDELRKTQLAQKIPPGYDRRCRHLTPEDVKARIAAGEKYTIRAKMPQGGKTIIKDHLRGFVEFENDGIDDQVLLKSDGFPTYHLANVVDDHLMEITHVIRAEEWIASTPKHWLLYDFFGWERPTFIHLPLLRNSDKSKISKRKNPTSINYYRRKGILPEAFCNFLALMGWSFGENREIFSLAEMIENFNWEHFSLGGPVFDVNKLVWLNGHYLRALNDNAYVDLIEREVLNKDTLKRIIPLIKDRLEKLEDFIPYTSFFFAGDLPYDGLPLVPKGRTAAETAGFLSDVLDALEALEDWRTETLKQKIEEYMAQKNLKPKDLLMPLRIATMGKKESPPLFESLEVIGKEMVRRRVRMCASYLLTLKETPA